MLNPGPGSPSYDQSKLVDFPTLTGPGTHGAVTAIRAKQDVKVTAQIGAYQGDGNYLVWFDQDGLYLAQDQQASNSGQHFQSLPISMVIPKGDYIFAYRSGVGNQNGEIQITAEPMQSPVILLESQDEIFSSWIEYSPTRAGYSTYSAEKYMWRRVGDSMEIMANFSGSTGSTDAITFTIPSGYSMDFTKLRGDNESNILGYAGKNTNHAGAYGFMVKSSEPQKIYVTITGSTNNIFNAIAGATIGNSIISGCITVPIQGWNSNFNPLLSMPLVDFTTYTNIYSAKISNSSTLASESEPWIKSVSNSTTGVCVVTFNDNHFSEAPSIAVAGDTNSTTNELIVSVDALSATACTIRTSLDNGVETSGDFWITVLRQGADHKPAPPEPTAAVIKPAICHFSETQANGTAGGSSGTNAYQQLYPNTFKGETWFISAYNGSLGAGGTNWQFTLEPGMYKIEVVTPFYKTNSSRASIKNVTDSIYYDGQNQYAASGEDSVHNSKAIWIGTITSAKAFAIYTWTSNAQSSNGLGKDISQGVEQFLQGTITKLK